LGDRVVMTREVGLRVADQVQVGHAWSGRVPHGNGERASLP
jgi:hypothetical protein